MAARDPRIEQIQLQIMALAAGDLNARGVPSPADDDLDAITVGLNMLAEDFRDRENARLLAEREREQATARSTHLEKANQALSEFAYVASHDLQEPLRMVSSFTQLLAKKFGGVLGPEGDSYVRFAVDGAERMRALIDDLLAYSRVGEHVIDIRVTDTSKLVKAVLELLRVPLEETKAEVEVDLLPTVIADGAQLSRVFQNLLGNALKYRSERPLHVAVKALHDDDGWHFSVADNGIGFEQRYAESVFGVFQRLHSRASYPGTGIGLAICRKIVEAHGGRIWAESKPGVGSTFHFTLPLEPCRSGPAPTGAG